MLEHPTILSQTRAHCAASWRDVFFNVWTGRGTLADIKACHAHQRAFSRRVDGGKFASFTLVHSAAVAPIDAPMREALAAMRRDLNPHTKAGILVIPMDGLAGAVLRSVLVGLSFVVRAAYPNHVVHTAREASRWLAKYLTPAGTLPITPDQITAAYDSLGAQPLDTGAAPRL